MTKNSLIASVLVVFVALVVLPLVSGASYLGTSLPGGLPLGNGLVALGLCASAGVAVVLSVRGSALRATSIASLVGAMFWLPISVVLAGNPQLNFSGGHGSVWLALSVAIFAAACLTLLWALGAAALAKIRGADAA